MYVFTYFRRGLWFVTVASTDAQALNNLRAEKGSVWFDWQLTSKARLSFANLPAQKLGA